jgi:hypothetical protein
MLHVTFIDEEDVYDPKLTNDRLLLGLKGTFSEFELSILRHAPLRRCASKLHEVTCIGLSLSVMYVALIIALNWTRTNGCASRYVRRSANSRNSAVSAKCRKETFPRGLPGNIPGATAVEHELNGVGARAFLAATCLVHG